MAMAATLVTLCSNASSYPPTNLGLPSRFSRRVVFLSTTVTAICPLTLTLAVEPSSSTPTTDSEILTPSLSSSTSSSSSSFSSSSSSSSASENKRGAFLGGISNTKSWLQFVGDGFAIRVPPLFEDVMEPEDYNAGLSLYGDKVKPKTFAARFASPDRSEVLTVVIRPSNQLKITFLEAQDIADLGSLKSAAKIFVPGGATVYNARMIKIKEEEDVRNYYFYEFGIEDKHVALMTTVISGKVFIAGAAAPQSRWEDDGIKLRSAAVSLSVL